MLKSKIVHNYKTSWNFSKFIDIYNIIIDLGTRDGILIVINSRDFLFFNHSLTVVLHRTPPMLISGESKKDKKNYKEVLNCL